MKKKTTFSIILVVLLATAAIITFALSSPSIDTLAKKLARSYPSAVIETVDTSDSVAKPTKLIFVDMGNDKILLYKFKDKASADYGALVESSGPPGKSFVIYSKGKILVKYTGSNQEIRNKLEDMLGEKPAFLQQ